MREKGKGKLLLAVLGVAVVVGFGYYFISVWVGSLPKLRYDYGAAYSAPPAYPDTRFAVISDLHQYDRALGDSGSAFEAVLYADRKLLLESPDLLALAVDDLLAADVAFVLVSGDMTKDGERVNHELAVRQLSRLTAAGIPVYVVPGNHDVNNPDAVSFDGDGTASVPSVSAEEFADIYADFGYGGAIYRDPDSLSYVAEPVEGMWLLAMDACRYRENRPGVREIVGGKLSQATVDWVTGVLEEAAVNQKAVTVLMHHGVVEHWDGQRKLHADYLVEEYEQFGRLLASYGARVAFTGHYHAQDITLGQYNGYIYDIMTGSLITAPCPYRICEMQNNELSIASEAIVERLRPGTDYAANAHAFVRDTVMLEARSILKGYYVSDGDADLIAVAVGDAFTAHYAGDENPAMRPAFDPSPLNILGRVVLMVQQYVLDGLWRDLTPGDNAVTLNLG